MSEEPTDRALKTWYRIAWMYRKRDFTTNQFADYAEITWPAAKKYLDKLAKHGYLVELTHNLYAITQKLCAVVEYSTEGRDLEKHGEEDED